MSLDKYFQLIELSYSANHAKKFSNRCLTNQHIDILKKSCVEIHQMLPPQPFECAFLSAALVEWARQKGIPSYLVAGSLEFKGRQLFNYDPVIEQKDIVENWDGHCWVIFNDAIAEMSLFRTAYSKKSPVWLKSMMELTFGKHPGAIIASILEIENMGLFYKPKYVFDDLRLSGLLNSVEQTISKTWDIQIDQDTSRIVCPVPGFSNAEIM